MVKELKGLMVKWNKLGDMYLRRTKLCFSCCEAAVFRAKSDARYKSAEELRALLLKLKVEGVK